MLASREYNPKYADFFDASTKPCSFNPETARKVAINPKTSAIQKPTNGSHSSSNIFKPPVVILRIFYSLSTL